MSTVDTAPFLLIVTLADSAIRVPVSSSTMLTSECSRLMETTPVSFKVLSSFDSDFPLWLASIYTLRLEKAASLLSIIPSLLSSSSSSVSKPDADFEPSLRIT